MFYEKKKKLQFLIGALLLIFSTYYLSKDYSLLGFFADDGTTLYLLLKDISFSELIFHSFNWDAARDLHLIWQKFFISISSSDKISSIHFYQVIFYILNVILFCYILRKLKFNNEIIIIVSVASLFFPAHSEVVLWIHAFTMVLISTLFFLIFIIFQIHILYEKNKKQILKLNILSIIFLLLTWFTYEQSIFVSFLVIIIINFIKLKKKIITKKIFKTYVLIYGLLIFSFSIYKLYSAGFLNPNTIKFQTGSNIVLDYQIFKNVLIGFAINLREFIIFDIDKINKINFSEILIFNLLLGFVFYLILIDKKKIKLTLAENNKNILIFFILFVASMFPLYFHYISDRHNYLPSFFMFTGIAYFLKYFYNNKSNFHLNVLLIIIIFYCMNNFLIKYNFKKYQLIENFKIKREFYYNLVKNNKNILYKKKNFLVNFPELREEEVFFAHEPAVNFKLITNNNTLPFVSIENEYIKDDVLIIFDKVKNNKVTYNVNIVE